VLAALLLIAGSVLTWAHNFVGDDVHSQFAAQRATFSPANSDAVKGREFAAMRQYGGQQLLTRKQA
jgi:hypothetical protein